MEKRKPGGEIELGLWHCQSCIPDGRSKTDAFGYITMSLASKMWMFTECVFVAPHS